MRTTPENIDVLNGSECFVFGSNFSGIHGGGAARLAYDKFGAIWGQGIGLQGDTYAIPTKDYGIKRTLRIDEIKPYVDEFIEYARMTPQNTFLVTQIGCGLAGYEPKDIAPLFKEAKDIHNIHLPESFWTILN